MPGEVALSLPDPCLVVLVGAAGSGKSTLAARLFPPAAVLSSDAYRAMVAGDEADQRATRTAFAILHRELERRMAARRTTVIDATSVTPFTRRGLLRRAAAHGVPAVAIVFDLDHDLILARNATRARRVVPESAVRQQLAGLARSLRDGLGTEGFACVQVLRNASDLDSLAVEWRPRTCPPGVSDQP